ncbi:hypothetical protein AVEN_245280-1 [Araneus ventricosus]|uniref:Uncharacterized protein n=1 Tax=Araneus ventricosus TaxID=182803 RepID=A0A4Y2VET5_ARAVE|nr:hypothetical protein AVEN_245280-1 [Araneus ventricosus]
MQGAEKSHYAQVPAQEAQVRKQAGFSFSWRMSPLISDSDYHSLQDGSDHVTGDGHQDFFGGLELLRQLSFSLTPSATAKVG